MRDYSNACEYNDSILIKVVWFVEQVRKSDRDFLGQLSAVVLPIAFQLFVTAAVGAGDAAMLGLISQDALAAVSLANQVQFVLNLFWSAIVNGVVIQAAQYWGRQNKAASYWTFTLALRYILIASALFCLGAVLVPELLMRVFTNEDALVTIGGEYLRVAGISYLFVGVSQCCYGMLKATGRAKRGAVISISCLVLDVVLNAVFIFGLFGMPAMGVMGAAWTTVVSRLLEMLLMGYELYIFPEWGDIWDPRPALAGEFWRCTRPLLVNSLVWGLGTATYSVILGHLGGDAVAANSVASVVRELAHCAGQGLSIGGGVILGNLLGAGELDRAREYGGKLSRVSVLCGVACMGGVLAVMPVLLAFIPFTDEAKELLRGMLWISAFYMVGWSVNSVVICGIFHSGGDTRFDAVSVGLTMWLFVIPLAAAAAFWWKLPVLAVYLIISLDEVVKLPWVYSHYRKFKWLKNMTE